MDHMPMVLMPVVLMHGYVSTHFSPVRLLQWLTLARIAMADLINSGYDS